MNGAVRRRNPNCAETGLRFALTANLTGNPHMLEVIDKGSRTDDHPAPLLFIHGGCHAAWCWDEHFLDFFAEKGFRAVALSWRGHGRSALSQRRRSCSMTDYLDDVWLASGHAGPAARADWPLHGRFPSAEVPREPQRP